MLVSFDSPHIQSSAPLEQSNALHNSACREDVLGTEICSEAETIYLNFAQAQHHLKSVWSPNLDSPNTAWLYEFVGYLYRRVEQRYVFSRRLISLKDLGEMKFLPMTWGQAEAVLNQAMRRTMIAEGVPEARWPKSGAVLIHFINTKKRLVHRLKTSRFDIYHELEQLKLGVGQGGKSVAAAIAAGSELVVAQVWLERKCELKQLVEGKKERERELFLQASCPACHPELLPVETSEPGFSAQEPF